MVLEISKNPHAVTVPIELLPADISGGREAHQQLIHDIEQSMAKPLVYLATTPLNRTYRGDHFLSVAFMGESPYFDGPGLGLGVYIPEKQGIIFHKIFSARDLFSLSRALNIIQSLSNLDDFSAFENAFQAAAHNNSSAIEKLSSNIEREQLLKIINEPLPIMDYALEKAYRCSASLDWQFLFQAVMQGQYPATETARNVMIQLVLNDFTAGGLSRDFEEAKSALDITPAPGVGYLALAHSTPRTISAERMVFLNGVANNFMQRARWFAELAAPEIGSTLHKLNERFLDLTKMEFTSVLDQTLAESSPRYQSRQRCADSLNDLASHLESLHKASPYAGMVNEEPKLMNHFVAELRELSMQLRTLEDSLNQMLPSWEDKQSELNNLAAETKILKRITHRRMFDIMGDAYQYGIYRELNFANQI